MDLFPIGNEPALVANDSRPVSADEANKRAYFFSRAMINRAARAAMDIANSKANLPGHSLESACRQFSKSIKILATVSTHLMMLEQSVVNGETWFLDYQILIYHHMDEELRVPRARALITEVGSLEKESMVTRASLDACTELGISHDGTIFLVKSVIQSLIEYGNTLLTLSLRESVEDLGKLLSSIINGPKDEDEEESEHDSGGATNQDAEEGFLRFDL